ncbi:hypothetical protein DD237_008544 [Peronospora effusa]|uniref:Crinkler effector protein N-terminal domain-containing protein n=1 Tax=Peronospora effusa TaxID=542832 RepID=A0A3R7XEX1_9STRA|nr:hypothetical protein DD237_008544 [Peronospora effusa]
MVQPSTDQIHVLVVVSEEYDYVPVKEVTNDPNYKEELTRYQQRGELIQRNCEDYCQQILSKIDALYALSDDFALPFICVEGSSGMGKSQLAFALGGSRPWFYWPTTPIGDYSQRLYRNFSSISDAFLNVTNKDGPTKKFKKDILNSRSKFYKTESLWTFGFIHALLKCCSEEQNQQGKMIRFQEKTSLYVEKCNREKVVAFRKKMKTDGKVLPFFVLDEMMPNMNIGGGGMNLAAFQRNVFRVCGLVVIVMGTDAKVTDLVDQSVGSYTERHAWMTVISRFPLYQSIPFANKDKQTAWNHLQAKYPILQSIMLNSRGRFAGYFADSAAQYAMENFAYDIKLCDLLDVAFNHVGSETQSRKNFMEEQKGKDAQLMAISYTNVNGTSPRPCKKRKIARSVGTYCMHLHFANLVDDQATEVDVLNGELKVNGKPWLPRCCFPDIREDMLLYLAVLGGKTYSGYYDHRKGVNHSTRGIFSLYWRGRGFGTTHNYYAYENMVAHMFFCASRRNGVQGIPFDDFFAGLLSECQDQIRPVIMTDGNTGKTIVASDILDKYVDLVALSHSKIPFLAPPNAEWPQCILDTRAEGCNFGHLVRARNDQKCDIFVCNTEDLTEPPLFLCECKYCDESVDFGGVNKIIGGLETVWKDKWAVALVFCVKLAAFENEWNREKVGCVKVDCRSGRVDWVFQPAEENRKKLVIVMETGDVTELP